MLLAWAVRRNSYFDSIDLMRVAEQVKQLAGVAEVAAVMGTPAGHSMLAETGMWPAEAPESGPSDLLVSVRASTETVANRALGSVDELLSAGRGGEPARACLRPRLREPGAPRSHRRGRRLGNGDPGADEPHPSPRLGGLPRDRHWRAGSPRCGRRADHLAGYRGPGRRPRYEGRAHRLEAALAGRRRRRAPSRCRDGEASRRVSTRV